MDEHLDCARQPSRRLLSAFGLIALVTLSLAGCTKSDSVATSADAAVAISPTVTIDVYSGRPNPSFDLSANETTAVSDALSGVLDADPEELGSAPSDVGFRGFVLTPATGGDTIVVSADGVWANGNSFADSDQSVYLQLRQMAVARDPALADLIPA